MMNRKKKSDRVRLTRHTHHKRDSTYIVIILLFWDGLDGEPYGAWPYIGTCLTFMYGIGMVSTCHALLGKSKIVDDRERPSFKRTKEGKNIINIILYSWKERERESRIHPNGHHHMGSSVPSFLVVFFFLHARYLVIFWTLLYSKSWACCSFLLRNSLPIK